VLLWVWLVGALFLLTGSVYWGCLVFLTVDKISIKVQSSLLLCFWLFKKKLT